MEAGHPLRTPPEPDAITLAIASPIRRGDVAGLCGRLRKQLTATGPVPVVCDLTAATGADLATVDALAALRRTARRLGVTTRLRGLSDELHLLLRLVGLCEAVGAHGPPSARECRAAPMSCRSQASRNSNGQGARLP